MRREIPIAICFLFGISFILEYFIPHQGVLSIFETIRQWAIIVIAFAYVLGIANLFMRFPMTGPTMKFPLLSADATTYLIGEQTHEPEGSSFSRITASYPTTAAATFEAVKLANRAILPVEFIEDASFEQMSFMQGHVAMKIGEGISDAIMNGDTASTHMDTNVTGSTDRRKAWLGLRAHAVDQTYSTDMSNALTAVKIIAGRASMGIYGAWTTGQKLACMASPAAYAKLLQDTVGVLTVDKYGPGAPVLTGEAARVGGVPIIPTTWMPENLNASGVYDGSTTDQTGAILVNLDGFALGERRSVKVRSSDEILMESDQVVVLSTWRGDFEDIYPIASNKIVWYLYNAT